MAGDILDIKRRLASSAQAVAELLLPGGKKEGSEWRAGSIAGEKGQSLGVHLVGQKAGVWADFSTGQKGDLLDLWCAVKRISLQTALDEARAYLGISRPSPYPIAPKSAYRRPPKPSCVRPSERVLDYLREDRNIPGHVIEKYKIGEQGDQIIFPFLDPAGELVMAKARKAVDGAAPMPTSAECEPILFGWQAVPSDAREVIITEGEIDALSWAAYGKNSLSVPFGGGKGGKQKWIENEYDRLDRFEKIFISTDHDGPGDEAAAEIASRLGRHRCYRVNLPHKDCNACLVEGVPQIDMDRCIAQASALDPEGLRRPDDFLEDVARLFWPQADDKPGYTMPYDKMAGKLNFRPAELTIWTGPAGCGKSQIISDCVPHWIFEGARICLSSLEMQAKQTLRRMVKQTGNVDRPTESFIKEVLGYLSGGLLLYDRVGKAGIEGLLEIFDYARAKYGCDVFIIDSLMRLGIAGDDYTGQEKVLFRIVDWTIQNAVHTHLVAHSRKSDANSGAPQTEDIKGAMEIGANAFNVLSIWRNRKREEEAKLEGGKIVISDAPGVMLNIAKQRNGDFEGKTNLWFDQLTYRYRSSLDAAVFGRRYVGIREDSVA